RCRTMAAAGYRTIHRRRAASLGERAETPHFSRVGLALFEPRLAGTEAGENAVRTLHHLRGCRGRGQARDDDIGLARHGLRGCAACGAALHAGRLEIRVKVPPGEVDAVTREAARELAADIAQADETDFDIAHARRPSDLRSAPCPCATLRAGGL